MHLVFCCRPTPILHPSSACQALELNTSVTDLDLSRNQLTGPVAVQLAKATRGHYVGTNLVSRLQWRKLVLNDNPGIGPKGKSSFSRWNLLSS